MWPHIIYTVYIYYFFLSALPRFYSNFTSLQNARTTSSSVGVMELDLATPSVRLGRGYTRPFVPRRGQQPEQI